MRKHQVHYGIGCQYKNQVILIAGNRRYDSIKLFHLEDFMSTLPREAVSDRSFARLCKKSLWLLIWILCSVLCHNSSISILLGSVEGLVMLLLRFAIELVNGCCLVFTAFCVIWVSVTVQILHGQCVWAIRGFICKHGYS